MTAPPKPSEHIRVASEFAAYLRERAARERLSLTDLTRKIAKLIHAKKEAFK